MSATDLPDFRLESLSMKTAEEVDNANAFADLLDLDEKARADVLDRAPIDLSEDVEGGGKAVIFGAPKVDDGLRNLTLRAPGGMETIGQSGGFLKDVWDPISRYLRGFRKDGDEVKLPLMVPLPVFQLDCDDWVDTEIQSTAKYARTEGSTKGITLDVTKSKAGAEASAKLGID